MPLDLYSSCPGGSGKKIKFCCPDLVGDLQKIERMIDGDQHVACLKHLERLEEKNPGRACLLAAKTLVLRLLDRAEEAAATAAGFLEKHPHNPIALAESAMAAVLAGDDRGGVTAVSKAISASSDSIHGRVYEALGVVAMGLAAEGQVMASRALCLVQLALRRDDQRAMELLLRLNSAQDVPLLIKEDRTLDPCPDGSPLKDVFQEAVTLADHARWLEAAERFESLSEQAPAEPAVWLNLALLRGWLADTPGCIEALHKYAALDVPDEDASEAEALALVLSEDPLGDGVDVVSASYTVGDADALAAVLGESPLAARIPNEEVGPIDDGPPPRAVFYLSDRPLPDGGQEMTLESAARVYCQAALFDRETDRPARLELPSVVSTDLAKVKEILAEAAGAQLDGEPDQEVIGQLSATRELLMQVWRLPAGQTREAFQDVTSAHLEKSLLETWPHRPLGLLGGKSPAEAASDGEDLRTKLMAAVLVVESLVDEFLARFDCNRLRQKLGLPELGPIDPNETRAQRVPLLRLARIEVDKLSDDALLRTYARAMAFGARRALVGLARAVVARPSLARHEERLRAYRLLARLAESPDETLQFIDGGRQAGLAAGQSCASWDLMELSLRFTLRQGPEVSRLMNHLEQRHIQEPGVADALTNMLIEVGLLRPDGSVAPAAAAPGAGPGIVVPGQEGAEPGKLWTPDGQTPPEQKGKIWTPGMD
jgi:hypothetical protein